MSQKVRKMKKVSNILLSVTVIGILVSSAVAKKLSVEFLQPTGIRLSLPDEPGVNSVEFNVNIFQRSPEATKKEYSIKSTRPTGNRWIFEIKNVVLKQFESISYWIYVEKKGEGFLYTDQVIIQPNENSKSDTSSTTTTITSANDAGRAGRVNDWDPNAFESCTSKCSCNDIYSYVNSTFEELLFQINDLYKMKDTFDSMKEAFEYTFKDQTPPSLITYGDFDLENYDETYLLAEVRKILINLNLEHLMQDLKDVSRYNNGIIFTVPSIFNKIQILKASAQKNITMLDNDNAVQQLDVRFDQQL